MSLKFEGLAELREALRNLPAELAAEATAIVEGAADAAAADIVAAYPEDTGTLKRRVRVTRGKGGYQYGAKAVVVNTAPHAWIFEHGTEARHYVTEGGATKLTGRMPPGNVFIPRMMRARRAVQESLAALLERHGLRVSRGD